MFVFYDDVYVVDVDADDAKKKCFSVRATVSWERENDGAVRVGVRRGRARAGINDARSVERDDAKNATRTKRRRRKTQKQSEGYRTIFDGTGRCVDDGTIVVASV